MNIVAEKEGFLDLYVEAENLELAPAVFAREYPGFEGYSFRKERGPTFYGSSTVGNLYHRNWHSDNAGMKGCRGWD